jgi:hypothetical protein
MTFSPDEQDSAAAIGPCFISQQTRLERLGALASEPKNERYFVAFTSDRVFIHGSKNLQNLRFFSRRLACGTGFGAVEI